LFFMLIGFSQNLLADMSIAPSIIYLDNKTSIEQEVLVKVKEDTLIKGFFALKSQNEFGEVNYEKIEYNKISRFVKIDAYEALEKGILIKKEKRFYLKVNASNLKKEKAYVNRFFLIFKKVNNKSFIGMQYAIPFAVVNSMYKGDVRVKFQATERSSDNNVLKYNVNNGTTRTLDLKFEVNLKSKKLDVFVKDKRGKFFKIADSRLKVHPLSRVNFYFMSKSRLEKNDLQIKVNDSKNKSKIIIE